MSVYIHWPFCLSKCYYCDFNSYVLSNIDQAKWLYGYKKQIENFSEVISGKLIKSIYFGGGTPSLMDPKVVEDIINRISFLGTVNNYTEITLEANPTSFEIEKFREFKAAGINRISIGVQSLIDNELKDLGRNHDAKTAAQAVEYAAKIFPKTSFDLIYGRSGQTLKGWQEELSKAINIASGHLSLYQLTVEKDTIFHKLLNKNKLKIPDDDTAAKMYEWTKCFMETKGYNRYEISNYATDSNESQHNLTYWHYNSYVGIGPGAHSRIIDYSKQVSKRVNSIKMESSPRKWVLSVNQSEKAINLSEFLKAEEIAQEYVMMGLRLKTGISIKKLESLTELQASKILDTKNLFKYKNLGLIKQSNDSLCLTDKGLIMHNYLLPKILI